MNVQVLLVRSRRDRQLYALKAIRKDHVIQHKEIQHTRAERDILVQLRQADQPSPFLIELHYAFQSPTHLYLVLDYFSGGDIATQMAKYTIFSLERTLFYAAEILSGLSVLHNRGIIYRYRQKQGVSGGVALRRVVC